jgi:uncharacterized protein
MRLDPRYTHSYPELKRARRVLAIDGGGVRGVLPALWLAHLEKTAPNLGARVDVLAGTSVGALLACALGLGIAADRLGELFFALGEKVFGRSIAPRLNGLPIHALIGPRYDGSALREVLTQIFADAVLADLRQPTLIVCYDLLRNSPLVIKSYDPLHRNLSVVDACMASSAAPTYFPPVTLRLKNHVECLLVDGGVAMNDPLLPAISDLTAAGAPLNKLSALSLGTGRNPDFFAKRRQQIAGWGSLEWLLPSLSLMFSGSGEATKHIARSLLREGNYLRWQAALSMPSVLGAEGIDNLDRADAKSMQRLKRAAQSLLRQQPELVAATEQWLLQTD